MQLLDGRKDGFWRRLRAVPRSQTFDPAVQKVVAEVLEAVRKRGNRAVVEYNRKFGGVHLSADQLRIRRRQLRAATQNTCPALKKALAFAQANITSFARRSLRCDWRMKNRQGAWVGEQFHPLQRVGCYVPGGTAPLVSTALMTITLAKVAGVPEIVAVTPPPVQDALLFGLHAAGATEIYQVGGAQAIAALAFGTETIRPVHKIVGPGNAYVTEAKRQVFGHVAIDLLAGPSEVLIVADDTASAAFVAADMLAQAEHGPGYKVYLVTVSDELIGATQAELRRQSATLSRKGIISAAQAASMVLIRAQDLAQAIAIANELAVEHVEIHTRSPERIARQLTTSGAIFLGPYTPTVVGDFVAGPSHVLPTGGAGKSFAGLTADQFQRRTSVIAYERETLRRSLDALLAFSRAEQLDAHTRSARIRFEED